MKRVSKRFWWIVAGLALTALAVAAFLYPDVVLPVLLTRSVSLARAFAITLLVVLLIGGLYIALRYRSDYGVLIAALIIGMALVLLVSDHAKAFLDRFLSLEYAGYMLFGGIVIAVMAVSKRYGR